MNRIMRRMFFTVFVIFIGFNNLCAQTDSSFIAACGIDASFINRPSPGNPFPSGPSLLPGYNPLAMKTCGLIDVYYDDINLGMASGFNDPTLVGGVKLGDIRQATFCQVITDIQAMIDFSKVSSSNHIRIIVHASFDATTNPATSIVNWVGAAAPYFDKVTPGIIGGYLNEYITTGVDNALSSSDYYHAHVQINFDKTFSSTGMSYGIAMQNDYTLTTKCKTDLYTVLLHEMTHALGWMSFVEFSNTCCGAIIGSPDCNCVYYQTLNEYTTPVQRTGWSLGPNVFTKLDTAITSMPTGYDKPMSSSLRHLVINSGGLYNINPLTYNGVNNYWINSLDAPDNYPVSSGFPAPHGDLTKSGSFLSHLEDQIFTYSFRERMSPGDRQYYVMGPAAREGVYRRTFSKGELQTLVRTLGYTLKSSFIASHPNTFNHLPYSDKMATMPINENTYMTYTEDNATIDYNMTNNVGSTQTINLSDFISSGDLTDADGDPITIDASTIVNFRGCGVGWNNHNSLSWSGTNPITITYTPRQNFYGKAQFGFNINDGNENGAFRVVTIDVKRGNNVSSGFSGGNMVCNGDFEEGSEIKTLADETKKNNYIDLGRSPYAGIEGKWQGVSFSDSHPYAFQSNNSRYHLRLFAGCVVKDSYIDCNGTITTGLSGHEDVSYPSIKHLAAATGGNRYQAFSSDNTTTSYYYLTENAKKCDRYILSYDIMRPPPNSCTGCFQDPDISIYLGDSIGSFNDFFAQTIYSGVLSLPVNTWQTITDTFYYCSDTASNILCIKTNNKSPSFDIDNISITKIASPPIGVTISHVSTTNCIFTLASNITNPGCRIQYLWTGPGGISSPTSATTTVTPPGISQYTLTVTDYCGTRTDMSTILINATVPLITGPATVCTGTSIALSCATAGGTWSTSNSSISSISPAGILTGTVPGTTTIEYTLSNGCKQSKTITVELMPGPITGPAAVCSGQTITLSNSATGGFWSRTPTTVATVVAGTVTGLTGGTVTITYRIGSCISTTTVTVHSSPIAVGAIPLICVGSPITITNATTGGTWVSTNPGIATIGSTTGLVSGVSTGTSTISYTTGNMCTTTKTITVSTVPTTIAGYYDLCAGTSISTLSTGARGGVWSSTNSASATVSPAGVYTGVSPGTSIIAYTNSCGSASLTATVHPAPGVITGPTTVCMGSTIALSNAVPGGVWSNTVFANGTVDATTGIVTGVHGGTATITYSMGSCRVTKVITVGSFLASTIGPTDVCIGSTITLSNVTSGGVWTSSNTTVADVGSSNGVVSGVTAGTVAITYSRLTCEIMHTVTVTPNPIITGAPSLCLYTGLLTSGTTLGVTVPGGTWVNGDPGVLSFNPTTLDLGPVSLGTGTITYTLGTCTATKTITVLPTPSPIIVPGPVCVGSSITLSDATPAGTWFSTSTEITLGTTTGILTGITVGTATITYQGVSCVATKTVTVEPTPVISSIPKLCMGSTYFAGVTPTGGSWSTGNSAIAGIDAVTGLVTGVSAGTVTITYVSAAGCEATTTATILLKPVPITGPGAVCEGGTITLSDATPGGTWVSVFPAIATVGSSSGIVTGNVAATAYIHYVLTSTGCFAETAVTVNHTPALGGPGNICAGTSRTITTTVGGGTWTSSNSTVTTVSSGGVVTGVAAGTTTLSYVLATGCMATKTMTVDPALGAITGPVSLCTGTTITLSSATPGGAWSSSSVGVATVAGGVVSGVTAGTATISYSKLSCLQTYSVTVNTSPAAITGPGVVCLTNSIMLSDATAGGGCSTAGTAALIDPVTGVVTPTGVGTAAITYTMPTGCMATYLITVDPAVGSITGNVNTCMGSSGTLTDADAGGVWSTSATVLTIGSVSGVMTPTAGGTATVTYTLSAGCATSIDVRILDGACVPCTLFGNEPFDMPWTGGAISTATVNPGYYYVDNPVNVTGTTLFNNAKIMMGATATMSVMPTANLTIDKSHLLGCDMWPGIVLATDGGRTTTGKLSVVNNSLIEDAIVGVKIAGAANVANILKTDDAIFNRNDRGIQIENFPFPASAPFVIRNTVFTSRNLKAAMAVTSGVVYPTVWPPTIGVNGLKTPWGPPPGAVYTPSLNIANPIGSKLSGPFNMTGCKNGKTPYCGIWIENVGAEIPSGTTVGGKAVPATYYEMTVGDDGVTPGNANQNVFDNMLVGVYARTSNVSCINNVFMNMVYDNRLYAWPSSTIGATPPPAPIFYPSGDGVYAGADMWAGTTKRLQVYTPAGHSYNNKFYGFDNAVESENYFCLNLKNSYMINETPAVPWWALPTGYRSGSYGMKLSSNSYVSIDVASDTINNVSTGISLWELYQPISGPVWGPSGKMPYQQYTGACNINNNVIQPHPSGVHTTAYEAVQMGIVVQNALTSYSLLVALGGASGKLDISSNKISDAYSGIYVNYSYQQQALTRSNNIKMRALASNGLRAGINYTQCVAGNITSNTVNTTTGAIATDDLMRAYYCSNNTGVRVTCNRALNTGRGFEFFSANPGTFWQVNEMNDNGKGMVLNGNGIIGQQGTATAATNNEWLGGLWTSGRPHTHVFPPSDVTKSELYVKTSLAKFQPTINEGYPGYISYKNYNFGTVPGTSIHPGTGAGASCPYVPPYELGGIGVFESTIKSSMLYVTSTMPKKWTNQYELWRAIQWDTTLVDSSAAIAQFATMAAHSRYAYLSNLETQLATSNVDSAIALLAYDIDTLANVDTDAVTGVRMADSLGANNIVNNYRDFYNLYLKYMQLTLNGEDSMQVIALAQKCPHIDGNVVYQARTLYSFMYNDINLFNDDSCMAPDTTYTGEWRRGDQSPTASDVAGRQDYHLYPNPNDGNLTLQQLTADTGMIKLEIYDIVGRSVYKEKLLFNNKKANLQLGNIVPGIYVLQLTDAGDKVYRFKFVKR